jgi:class 3 adenylate cyclase
VEEGRYIAAHIDGARFLELEGDDHVPWVRLDEIIDPVEEFLTGSRPTPPGERVLATLLFVDLVGSTAKAEAVGDSQWGRLLEQHHQLVRAELARFSGEEVDTAGDGLFALFDGPARAIRCALAIQDAIEALGLQIRAGVHTGEVERPRGAKPRGIAVHVGARIATLAEAGEVLVSATTRDLVAGSGLRFADRGEHELKGLTERRRVYATEGAGT